MPCQSTLRTCGLFCVIAWLRRHSQQLLFGGNDHFVGTIPDSINALNSLATLDGSDCSLTGTLPPQLAKLAYLVSVNFSSNDLTGTIPSVRSES